MKHANTINRLKVGWFTLEFHFVTKFFDNFILIIRKYFAFSQKSSTYIISFFFLSSFPLHLLNIKFQYIICIFVCFKYLSCLSRRWGMKIYNCTIYTQLGKNPTKQTKPPHQSIKRKNPNLSQLLNIENKCDCHIVTEAEHTYHQLKDD